MAKPGKYEHIIDLLPRSFGLEPEFQEKVDAVKKQILEADGKEEDELSSDAIESLVLDIAAMQSAVNDVLIKSVNRKPTAARLTRAYRDVRQMKEVFDKQEKVTNILIEAYEQLMVAQFEAERIKSIALEDGGTFYSQSEPHAQVIDRDANRKWAIKEGLESMLAIPWQTVNALAKKAVLEGAPEPDGVTLTARPKIVYRR